MNGYSGVVPESSQAFWPFPEDRAIDAMRSEGATHVMVHLEKFGGDALAVVQALNQRADLRLIGADREGHRLYQFVAARNK